ncbi:MAG: hypothetical protein DWQ06_07335 [Calditrichaeota bacterium]|nr:MAG: hypothetical protein DWQ06_07335 [Calditrichota bacterium]
MEVVTGKSRKMLIDKFLPNFTFNEIHKTKVNSTPEKIYPILPSLDFSDSWISKILFRLRGLPVEEFNFKSMFEGMKFSILEENQPNEILIGLLVNSKPETVKIPNSDFFVKFNENNSLKIAWNFTLEKLSDSQTLVQTETRILCSGKKMKNRFSIYWFFVRPFSGLIRMEMLKIVKKKCE